MRSVETVNFPEGMENDLECSLKGGAGEGDSHIIHQI